MRLQTGSLWVDVPDDIPATARTADGSFVVRRSKLGTPIAFSHNADYVIVDQRGSDEQHRIAPDSKLGTANIFVRAGQPGARPAYWSPDGRSLVDEMLAVVAVDWPLPDEPFLRPPAVGMSSVSRALRERPILERELRVDRLPQIIDLSDLPNVPSFESMTKLFGRFSGDICSGWSTDTKTPDEQHQGYGTYLLGCVSQADVLLVSKAPPDVKRPLAVALAQWGLDLASAFSDGRNNGFANGGHMLGRKPIVVLLGHLLNHRVIMGATGVLGRVFAEDHVFQSRGPLGWWHGDPSWQSTWQHSSDWGYVARHPHTWTPSERLRWGYISQVCGASVGTVLAMSLMGRHAEIGWPMVDMIRQWMQGPPDLALAQLADAGMSVPWGNDYSIGQGAGFCAAAWRQVEARAAKDPA